MPALGSMKATAAALCLGLLVAGCGGPPPPQTKEQIDRALRNFGFKSGGNYQSCWLCCGEDDVYRYTFTAKNLHGETVTGQACAGFFKAWTVRVD